ncbi:hypothetical protein HYE28_02920 [Mycoplasmopsis bovis]|nr:hypothetical protein [Mycoplasmopsis bovis]QQH23053.1 hypothetical protein HYE28_02920 [Mycoplasmopsis bovis]
MKQFSSGSNSITGDELLNFVNNELLKTLKEIKINPDMPFRKQIVNLLWRYSATIWNMVLY